MKCLTSLLVLLSAAAAWAVAPASWIHSTEADFAKGELKSTATTSHGEVILARKVELVMPSESAPAVVSAVAAVGKRIYAASGSKAQVWRIDGGKAGEPVNVPGAVVCCLAVMDGKVLVGTGGAGAGIYRLDPSGKVTRVWTDEKVKYVWAIAAAGGGGLYAATGPEGKVFAVEASGKSQMIYHADGLVRNILCLAVARDGSLCAGTDKEGLVIRIDPKAKSGRVILDAEEKEVSAVLVDGNGGVFAATADAAKAGPDGKVPPNDQKGGKAAAGPPGPTTRPSAPSGNTNRPRPTSNPGLPATAASRPASVVTVKVAPGRPVPAGPPKRPGAPRRPKAKGNAVYYIQPDGLVQTVFRRPVTILAMTLHADRLVLGTGNGGAIYSVTRDGDEIVQLLDTEARQVTALAGGEGGNLVFGTANKGSVGILADVPAASGTFTSKPQDAKQIAKWGSMRVLAESPEGTSVTFATRSGNLAEPGEQTYGPWSDEQPATERFLPVKSAPGRFLQYRLTLKAAGEAWPTVKRVEMVYQVGNLPPAVASLRVIATERGSEKGPVALSKVFRLVQIQAADPNGDRLTFTVAFRELGTDKWIEITDSLTAPKYVWDTRTVGDGAYELRVTASDKASNPPESAREAARISQRVVVDNTPPQIRDLAARVEGKEKVVSVSALAIDALSRIASLDYAVDSQDEWKRVLPADGIADNLQEKMAFPIRDLKPGAHRIAVRATDLYGNTGHAAVTVTIEE